MAPGTPHENAMGLAVDDTSIYYGTKGTAPDYPDGILYKVPKGGGQPVVLATGLNRPLNVIVDARRVYRTNGGHTNLPDGSVESIAKTGADRKTIATALTRPGNPVLVGDRLSWTVREQPTGRIVSAKSDGSEAVPTEIATGISNATDLQQAGTTLVWSTSGTDAGDKAPIVERANLDGTGRMPLASGIASPSFQIGVAPDAVFIGSSADGSLRRLPFDLGTPTTLATALGTIQETRVDGSMVFVTTGNGARVLAIPMTGGAPVVIADGQTFPSYIATDAEYAYWTDGPIVGAATVRRAKKAGR